MRSVPRIAARLLLAVVVIAGLIAALNPTVAPAQTSAVYNPTDVDGYGYVSGSVSDLAVADGSFLKMKSYRARPGKHKIYYTLWVPLPRDRSARYVGVEIVTANPVRLWLNAYANNFYGSTDDGTRLDLAPNTPTTARLDLGDEYRGGWTALLIYGSRTTRFTHKLDYVGAQIVPGPTRLTNGETTTSECGTAGPIGGLELYRLSPNPGTSTAIEVGDEVKMEVRFLPGETYNYEGLLRWNAGTAGGWLTVDGCDATYQAPWSLGTAYQTSANIFIQLERAPQSPSPTPTYVDSPGEGGPVCGDPWCTGIAEARHSFYVYDPSNDPGGGGSDALCGREYLQVALPDDDDYFYLDRPSGATSGPYYGDATFQPTAIGTYGVDIYYGPGSLYDDEYVVVTVRECGYAKVIRG